METESSFGENLTRAESGSVGRKSEISDSKQVIRDYFKANQDFLSAYAQDNSFNIKPGGFTLPDGQYVGFAIDLKSGDIFADPKYFSGKNYSPQKAMGGFLHEIEHLRELRELLDERGGYKIWQQEQRRWNARPRLQLLDNCVGDTRCDRNMFRRAPAQELTRKAMYRENKFPETDFRSLPKHLQFAYAIPRETILENESVQVDDDVRRELDRLRSIKTRSGRDLINFLTDPALLPSTRLRLQRQFLEPVYERFFKEDVERRQEQEESEEGKSGKKGKKGRGKEGRGKGRKGQPAKAEHGKGKPVRPEDYFKEEYKDFFERRSPRATAKKSLDEAIRGYGREKGKSDAELLAEAYAREQGVTTQEIQRYQNFWQEIENLRNPETDEFVVEELRKIFRRIIAERKKPVTAPKIPRAEGQVLLFPVRAFLDSLAGREESLSWLSFEKKERTRELYGQFDITWVLDRSDSMNWEGGQKRIQQKIGTVLCLEAIKEFCDDLDEARVDIKQDLEVRSEVWSFGAEPPEEDGPVEILKPLSSELTERQRVNVFNSLDNCPGSTPDFLALERIRDSISQKDLDRIAAGRLRKIIVISTDGGSDNSARLKNVVADLRDKGILVVAVGNGIPEDSNDAATVRTNYAHPDGSPGAQICPDASQTPLVYADLLKIFLSDLM